MAVLSVYRSDTRERLRAVANHPSYRARAGGTAASFLARDAQAQGPGQGSSGPVHGLSCRHHSLSGFPQCAAGTKSKPEFLPLG